MDVSIIIIAGLSMMFSFAIVKWKLSNDRVADGILDLAVFGTIMYLTAGSLNGMVIGVIASTLFSIYLLWSPFNLNFMNEPRRDVL